MAGVKDIATLRGGGGEVRVLVALLKLASIVGRPMKEDVADGHGITTNELQVMMCLGGEGALAGQDIADLMAISPMNVSRALARLKDLGWTEPLANDDNRRRRPVQLSAAGWRAYGEMVPDVRRVARHLFSTLDRSEVRTLSNFFDRMIEQIESWDESADAKPGAPKGERRR